MCRHNTRHHPHSRDHRPGSRPTAHTTDTPGSRDPPSAPTRTVTAVDCTHPMHENDTHETTASSNRQTREPQGCTSRSKSALHPSLASITDPTVVRRQPVDGSFDRQQTLGGQCLCGCVRTCMILHSKIGALCQHVLPYESRRRKRSKFTTCGSPNFPHSQPNIQHGIDKTRDVPLAGVGTGM